MTDDTPFSKEELLQRMEDGWVEFDAYISSLTEEQLTQPTDNAGWTAKDHLIHLALWAAGITALLDKQPRWDAMGITRELLAGEYDASNEAIRQQNQHREVDDVLATLRAEHHALAAAAVALTEEELELPYNHYQPDSENDRPVWNWIVADSFAHYDEHRPWIEAIVGRGE